MKLEEYKIDNSYRNKILRSIDLENIKIILLDDSEMSPVEEGRKNLLAIDNLNNVLWIADLPKSYLFASYWTIEIRNNELYALCGSFLCQIDIKTGKIINERFVK